MYSGSRFHLQQVLSTLSYYVTDIGLEINDTRTVAMKFRNSSRLRQSDGFRLDGENLQMINSFT